MGYTLEKFKKLIQLASQPLKDEEEKDKKKTTEPEKLPDSKAKKNKQ